MVNQEQVPVRNEKACRATRWLAVGGRARQRVGERVKRQVGAQQGAEERLVYGWLINQKSLIYLLLFWPKEVCGDASILWPN
jgi:hypothetical protein